MTLIRLADRVESGSKDAEGLARLAALIGERLTRLGGKVEIVEPTDVYRMDDTPPRPGAMRSVRKML